MGKLDQTCCRFEALTRRDVLTAAPTISVALTLPGRAMAQGQNERAKADDLLVPLEGERPFAPRDIAVDAPPILVWPMEPATKLIRNGSRLNKVLLLRLDPATLAGATSGHAADGVVAYTAICPHTGCDVTGWLTDQKLLECPCHSSQYDPREAGTVIAGPAPRALPALPLKIVDGKLAVAKPFTSRVGFTQG
jgi:rieske iron-sulfur protein